MLAVISCCSHFIHGNKKRVLKLTRRYSASYSGDPGFASRSSATDRGGAGSVVARTLYRQLLRWCRVVDPRVPLASLVPPVHIQESDSKMRTTIDQLSSKVPTDAREDQRTIRLVRSLLPRRTSYTGSTAMTVPICSVQDLRQLFRAIFRLNASDSLRLESSPRECIALGFEALKSLNELSVKIQHLQARRRQHEDRSGVRYKVGQVVRHARDRWRGIIIGWDRPVEVGPAAKTSLTRKDYSDSMENVKYDVLLDEGDAHMLGSLLDRSKGMQADLELVQDPRLVRVRNDETANYFARFDKTTLSFIPRDHMAYEYPVDVPKNYNQLPSLSEELAGLAADVVKGVQELATRLERCILDETSCPAQRGSSILSNVQSRLSAIAAGDVFVDKSHQFSCMDPSPLKLAALHLGALLNISLEIEDVMSHRRQSLANRHVFRFSIGDIILHKRYGFRGVIVARDPRPIVDVTRWDGLDHIENPMDLPFYHVVADQGDCIKAFGGPRSMRYVCEENIDPCPDSRLLVNVDLNPGWRRSESGKSFIPPNDHHFKHGGDVNDDGISQRCMERLEEAVNSWQVCAKMPHISDPVIRKLSTDNMLKLLKSMDSASDAAAVQELMKEMRKAHPSLQLRWMLEEGKNYLLSGKVSQACQAFQSIIAQDSTYVEAVNKLATGLFMMGRLDEAEEAATSTLALDPQHFQALNGFGLIHFEKGDYEQAIDCFQKSARLDPWSPVLSKLAVAMDLSSRDAEPEKFS